MKKLFAFILVIVLLLPTLTACGRSNNSNILINIPPIITSDVPVAARMFYTQPLAAISSTPTSTTFADYTFPEELLTPRNGYILAPTMHGLTGIDTLSSFYLITPYETQPGESPNLSIDGQPHPTITRENASTFLITPAVALSPNSVYIFRLTRSNQADITWAFQTTVRFELLSTLPRNQATNVPVRTGIEFNFSINGETNIEDRFSIYPAIEGRFIHRDNTAVFMPTNPLNYNQIYTVTINGGIELNGTSEVITSDHVFSFETTIPPIQSNRRDWTARIHFSRHYVEFPTFAQPSVNFWFNYNRDNRRPVIDINVYQLEDITQAIRATNRLANSPSWAHSSQTERFVDTSNLTRVYSSRITDRESGSRWNESFTISRTLPPGFYVLYATTRDSSSQVIIQITDLAIQVVADDNKAIVWVNDMTTGQPADGARVHYSAENATYETSEYGIAVVEHRLSTGEHLLVSAANGMEAVVFIHHASFQSFHNWGWWEPPLVSSWDMDWSPRFSTSNANDLYWSALQLDRTLFQRSDTLNLWGFIQNRRQEENITFVTATITESSWWHGPARDTLHRQNIPVSYGAYSGQVTLPHLDPGFYELAISHNGIVISSMFFSIQDYVKPPYQLTLSVDKVAAFIGEEVTFTARTEFFEGTPVPDLDLSYWISGHNLTTPSSTGRATTDLSGVVERTVTLAPSNDNAQGQTRISLSAEATLPEIGWVHEHASARVFINDINVRPKATHTDGNATLTVNVHNITLDRLNNGTAAHGGDFLCSAVSGQQLSVDIYRIYWVRIRDGERYDFITRQVVPRYRHERREERLESFTITTNNDGEATRDFRIPNRKNESYEARIRTTDGNGRTIRHNAFIGRDWSSFHRSASDDFPFLYGARPRSEGYDIGDLVELTVMAGTEPLTQGNILFVVVQDGILSYYIGSNTLLLTFEEQHVPNSNVFAFHFNGHTYHTSGQMSQRLHFNSETRNLIINVETCQEHYRPGDMSTITVTATDLDGNPKAANINISLVDEALFALMDYNVDTLATLYSLVSDRLRFGLATHMTFVSDGIEEDDESEFYSADAAMAPAAAESAMAGGSDAAGVRERFEDTATFKSIRTNENGTASFTFQLPDNITSWRMTASGISTTLYAGNTVQNIRVTQPMFLHYTLNSTFLTGDTPYIGVNAFGTSLSGGEQVTFEVWCETAPEDIRSATGASFERVNIPLWEMTEEGWHSLVVRATVGSHTDAVRHFYQVLNSHRQIDMAVFYEVTPNTVFDINPQGLTNITFTDHGRSQFLSSLIPMRWTHGARIEGLIARREATRLIEANFPDTRLFGKTIDFDVLDYQTESGGIAMLPYADANLETTVMLMPFIMDEVNTPALRRYLNNIFHGTSQDNKMLALYGLAMLGEPVLLDLQNYAMVANLSVRNTAYVALGLAALGETQAAEYLFTNRIEPHIQRVAPYYRVNVGNNRIDILDATSVVALLAAQLGKPQSIGLHNYAVRRLTCDLTLHLERLAFISLEIENHNPAAASITYTLFGEEVTRDLSGWRQFTLRIPAQNFHEFNIVSVTGDVGAVSIVRTPLEEIEPVDNDIIIRREFFRAESNTRADTFEQDEIIRVQISIDYSARDISGSYVITDFLPAGLALVDRSARFGSISNTSGRWRHATTEGQRVTFFDFNGRFDRIHVYYYYARVINPGTFRAEGTLVQSIGAREYLSVGEDAVIVIQG